MVMRLASLACLLLCLAASQPFDLVLCLIWIVRSGWSLPPFGSRALFSIFQCFIFFFFGFFFIIFILIFPNFLHEFLQPEIMQNECRIFHDLSQKNFQKVKRMKTNFELF